MKAILERSRLQVHLENRRGPRSGARVLFCPCGCPIRLPARPGSDPDETPFCPGCGTRLSKLELSVLDPGEDRF